MEKVVLRFNDGRVLKGYLEVFSSSEDFVRVRDLSGEIHSVAVEQLKALFFVKTFEGDPEYDERKAFSGSGIRKKKVFIRFKDGESMTGYIEGEMPWQKGYFLESGTKKGFFLLPTDPESNNIKVFVVTTSVKDVTLVG